MSVKPNQPARYREPVPAAIWVMVVASFVIAIGYGLVAPVLPLYAKSFNVTTTAATVVVSIFAVFRMVFAPASGVLVNRLGERPVYIAGVVIVALSSLAVATAHSYWQLIIYRGLGGIGSVMFTVSAAALIIRLSPPGIRGRISSYYGGAFLLGNITGPVIGGVLANIAIWLPFVAYGVALLSAACVVGFFLSAARVHSAGPRRELPPMAMRTALQQPAARSALGSFFANGWTNLGVRISIVPLFAATLSSEVWVSGAALTAFALGNAAIVLFAGSLTDRIGRKTPIIMGLGISGALTIAIGFSDVVPIFILLCALAGLGAGILNPAQQAAVADIIGADHAGGKVVASFQMIMDLGAIIGPLLIGLLVDYGSYPLAFSVSGLILVLAALGWLPAPETAPKRTWPETA